MPKDIPFENFRGALCQEIEEHLPGFDRDSDAANDRAWAIADQYAAVLWAEMHREAPRGK